MMCLMAKALTVSHKLPRKYMNFQIYENLKKIIIKFLDTYLELQQCVAIQIHLEHLHYKEVELAPNFLDHMQRLCHNSIGNNADPYWENKNVYTIPKI